MRFVYFRRQCKQCGDTSCRSKYNFTQDEDNVRTRVFGFSRGRLRERSVLLENGFREIDVVIKSVLVADRLIEPNHHQFENIRELSEFDLEQIETATTLLGAFNASFSLFEICQENYQSVEEFYRQLCTIKGLNLEKGHRLLVKCNTLVINYLSAFRTFIDHQERALKKISNEQLDLYSEFKKQTALHFDQNLSYRFLWYLRNYVQHCGLPLGGVEIKPAENEEGSDISNSSIYLNRDTLLHDFGDWKGVRKELQNFPEEIDVIPHIRSLQESLNNITSFMAYSHLERLGEHWNYLVGIVNEVAEKYPDGAPCIAKFDVSDETNAEFIGFNPLSTHIMIRIQEITNLSEKTSASH